MRIQPNGVIAAVPAVRAHGEDEVHALPGQPAQVQIHRIVTAFIHFLPACQRFDAAVNFIIQAEGDVTFFRIVLTVDNRSKAVSRLHGNGGELSADETITFVLRIGQQAGLILG